MPNDNQYRIVFMAVAAVVLIAAFAFGKCSKEDDSYKMAGVGPGDIVVDPYSKANPRGGRRAPTKARKAVTGDGGL